MNWIANNILDPHGLIRLFPIILIWTFIIRSIYSYYKTYFEKAINYKPKIYSNMLLGFFFCAMYLLISCSYRELNLLSDLDKILLTAFGSILVYTIGQIISKFYIDPLHDLLKCIGETSDILIYHADCYSNPGYLPKERMDETSKILRQKASQLRAKNHAAKAHNLFYWFGYIPHKELIDSASFELIGLSNSVYKDSLAIDNCDRREKIKNLLNIP